MGLFSKHKGTFEGSKGGGAASKGEVKASKAQGASFPPASAPAAALDRVELLKGLSGFVRPYDLLALMGE